MKFCIGDIVKGNKEADRRYGVTTSDCTGEVIGVEVYKESPCYKQLCAEYSEYIKKKEK